MKKYIAILFFTFFVFQLFGQQYPETRKKIYTQWNDTIVLDTLSIIPESLYLVDQNDSLISPDYYSLDFAKSLLMLQNIPEQESITVYYQVFPFDFSKEFYHKDFNEIKGQSLQKLPELGYYRQDVPIGSSQLKKNGSISRGLSFGNQQDAILNSNLNLQLSGKLNKDLNIKAAISDANIPIQPDGSSQQIQEFDKVFIQVYNDQTSLVAGDFELNKTPGYFFKLNKKAKGALFSNQWHSKNHKTRFKTTVSGAISKGKYCRKQIAVSEGNQGPYRLQGCDNENYIIILSGSEKVFVDGQLLLRGQENDYVINYNTAEISFTPNQLITKDKRVIVEFEYAEQNYTRFLFYNSNEFQTQKSRLYLNLYNESDSKNQTLNIDLNDDQKLFLKNTGDNIEQAYYPNIFEDSIYNRNYIYYLLKDSIVNYPSGETIYYDSIFEYTTNPDLAQYRLGFSFVGEMEGDYMVAENNVNGKVYEWISPDEDGTKNGAYEPVILLITPKKKQMITLGGETRLNRLWLGYELGITNNDINTFSDIDAEDNTGYALKINAENTKKEFGKNRLSLGANYEYNDRNFLPVERYRPAEFERDWNISNLENRAQHFATLYTKYTYNKWFNASAESGFIKREDQYSANRNQLMLDLIKSGNKLFYKGSYVNTEALLNNTAFYRHAAEVAKTIRSIQLGLVHEIENNQWRDDNSDSLLNNSFSFNQWEAYLKNADSLANNFFLSYKNRQDYLPELSEDQLLLSTIGEDVQLGYQRLKNPKRTLKSTLTYRKLSILDTALSNENEDRSLLMRIESNLRLLDGSLGSSTIYEVGSGLESIKEYTFVEVDRGLGIYIWNDYNENNIQELEEFEIAAYKDTANYLRVQLPGNYIKVYQTSFNQTLNLRSPRDWHNKEGMLKILSRFSDQFAYKINSKTKSEDLLKNINPFQTDALNEDIVSLSYSVKNTLFFNRTNPVFGMDYSILKNSRKDLLLSGFNTRESLINTIRLRWNITQKITLNENAKTTTKSYNSEAYSTKNYDINEYENRLSLDYLPSLSMRISLIYNYAQKENQGSENARENNIGMDMKYNVKSKGNLVFQFNYLNLQFTGDIGSPLAYEMLQGFLPGDNFTWTVQYQQQLANSLQLNFTYNGRKLPDTAALHAGGMQLRAFF